MLIQTHARRLPLLDADNHTGDEAVISVLTQYRLLKFIAINVCLIPSLYAMSSLISWFVKTVQGDNWSPPPSTPTQYWDICDSDSRKSLPSYLLGDTKDNGV